MSRYCVRCRVKAPEDYLAQRWAAPLDIGGVMCPACYESLCTIRTTHAARLAKGRRQGGTADRVGRGK